MEANNDIDLALLQIPSAPLGPQMPGPAILLNKTIRVPITKN